MSVSVTCDRCGGAGKRTLTDQERDTLTAVGRDWRTTAEIRDALGDIGRTAIVMRLTRLREAGLVERRYHTARHYAWRVTP